MLRASEHTVTSFDVEVVLDLSDDAGVVLDLSGGELKASEAKTKKTLDVGGGQSTRMAVLWEEEIPRSRTTAGRAGTYRHSSITLSMCMPN